MTVTFSCIAFCFSFRQWIAFTFAVEPNETVKEFSFNGMKNRKKNLDAQENGTEREELRPKLLTFGIWTGAR